MTISIKVSVNGDYEVPVTVQYDDKPATTEVISGKGINQPFVKDIPYYHGGAQIVAVTVGPEKYVGGN